MSTPLRFARKRLDISTADLFRGLGWCLHPPTRGDALDRLRALWTPPDSVVACLSVRSGLDLLLGCVDWPAGSEVLVSALTIPHIATLLRAHGYQPVAVDVDPDTLELDLDEVRSACTSRTRAVIYAHLLGARADLSDLAQLAAAAHLMLIEDRAQCYDGTDRDLGPDTDVAMYSFGAIKTATCLGGGVLLVGDPALRSAMLAAQERLPRQTRSAYAARLVKGAVMLAIGHPVVYPRFARVMDAVTGDFDQLVRTLSRGYPDRDLLPQIRRQPSTPLLAVMAYRLGTYDPRRIAARRGAGEVLAAALAADVAHLGGAGRRRTHWLFPVSSRDPARLVAAGRAAGFDLTEGSSTLVAVDERCNRAGTAISSVVYLPAYGGMADADLLALADVVNRAESRASERTQQHSRGGAVAGERA